MNHFQTIWARFSGAGIRIKIMGITVGLIVLLNAGMFLYYRNIVSGTLTQAGLQPAIIAQVWDATTEWMILFFLAMLALGISSGLVLSGVVTRPVQRLMIATQAARKGDLSQHVDAWFQDEIGDLIQSFNAMSDALAQAIHDTEAQNHSLVQQNRELALLNSISQAVISSADIRDILAMALDTVLETVNAQAGWICLANNDHLWQAFSVHRGFINSPEPFVQPGYLSTCPYENQGDNGIAWFPTSVCCDCISRTWFLQQANPEGMILSFALHSKSHELGRLNAVCRNHGEFDEAEQRLLKSAALSLGIAIENLRLWDEVRQKEGHRTLLLKKLVTVQEDEHRRIARELHDEMGQGLTSLLIGLKVLEKCSTNPEAAELIQQLKSTVQEILTQIRKLTIDLRPSVLDDLGLTAALKRLTKDFRGRMNVEVDLDILGMENTRLPAEIETALYRIIQESLTNIARHAHTNRANVLLEFRGDAVTAVIEDNGCGFDPLEVMATDEQCKWLGLFGIEERAQLLGGKTTIESSPGHGTTIFVAIPIPIQEHIEVNQ